MQLARWRVIGAITRCTSTHPAAAPTPLASRHRIHMNRTTLICQASKQESHDIHPKAKEVLQYWLGDNFLEAKPNTMPQGKQKIWFMGGPEVDKEMVDKFGDLLEEAAESGLPDWSRQYNGLAAVLLLDQFSRNVYRGNALMFAMDGLANEKAQSLIDNGDAASFPLMHRLWLLYPFMHSEKLEHLQTGMEFIQNLVDESKSMADADEVQKFLQSALGYCEAHHKVIKQWGRYPHRNHILGRDTTPEEEDGMANGSIPKFA